jgi:hypothetical protein
MTAGKITLFLAISASIKLLSAQDDPESVVLIRQDLENVQSAQKNFESALTEALAFDIDKARDMPSSSSPEERHEAFIKVMIRNGTLLHDANRYLQASSQWKEDLQRVGWASRPEQQTLIAQIDKLDACARAAVEYGKAVVAFADALKSGESGEAELKRVPQARKRLVDSMAAPK